MEGITLPSTAMSYQRNKVMYVYICLPIQAFVEKCYIIKLCIITSGNMSSLIIIIIVLIQSKDENTYPKLQWKCIKKYAIKYNSNIR